MLNLILGIIIGVLRLCSVPTQYLSPLESVPLASATQFTTHTMSTHHTKVTTAQIVHLITHGSFQHTHTHTHTHTQLTSTLSSPQHTLLYANPQATPKDYMEEVLRAGGDPNKDQVRKVMGQLC